MNSRVTWLPFGLSRYTGKQVLGGGFIVLVLALLPYLDSNSSHISAVADAGYILLLAFGLNIIVGYTGLLALGFAAFFAIGAYTYAFLASPQLASPAHPDGYHVSFWLMLLVSAAVAAAFGVILGAPTLRLRGDYLAIVTLGFGEIVRIFLNNLNAPVNITNGPQGINLIDPFRVNGFSLAH